MEEMELNGGSSTNVKKFNKVNQMEGVDDDFTIYYGVVDPSMPDVLYIEMNAYVCPTDENKNYSSRVMFMKNDLQNSLNEYLKHSMVFFTDGNVHMTTKENAMRAGKKSYFSVELLIVEREYDITEIEELEPDLRELAIEMVSSLKESMKNNNFSIYKE